MTGEAKAEAKPSIGLAHDIARMLWDGGFRGPDGLTVLAMAMGIYMEAQEGSHRNLRPISDTLCTVAVQTFDALRQGAERRGHA